MSAGLIVVRGTEFVSNRALGHGGAVSVEGGTARFEACRFVANDAIPCCGAHERHHKGGGAYILGGSATFPPGLACHAATRRAATAMASGGFAGSNGLSGAASANRWKLSAALGLPAGSTRA